MYETLRVFLRNERRLSDSLEELGIHRNSLIYRLERIQQIADCDLDDADTREWLLFSFRMVESL
jgi:DNA-binding PucR family transcriptional regulator